MNRTRFLVLHQQPESFIIVLIVWSNSYWTNIFLVTYWKGYAKVTTYMGVNHLKDDINLYKVSLYQLLAGKQNTQTPQIILHSMQRETASKSTRYAELQFYLSQKKCNFMIQHQRKQEVGGAFSLYGVYINFFSNNVLHFQ